MKPTKYLVFFDFDNTITPFDVLDDIIERFSIDKKWVEFERIWKEGKIGSRECLEAQLRSIRITRKELFKYLLKIRIDPYFSKVLSLLKKKGIKPVILSDDFSFVIRTILRNNGVRKVTVYSNKLKFKKDRLIPSFPHTNIVCFRCGHCKKNNLLRANFEDKIIYVGDGLSDVCPAESSDIVFAKGGLSRHFRKKRKKYIPFKSLKDVYNYIKPACLPIGRPAGRQGENDR